MKQLIFLFLFSVCAVFAHTQDALNNKELSGEIVIPADTWVATPGTDLKLNPIPEPTWRIAPSEHYTTLGLIPSPDITLVIPPENLYEVPWMTKEDLFQIIEKLEKRIEDLEARNKPGMSIGREFYPYDLLVMPEALKNNSGTTWEAGSGLEIQESETNLTIVNKKSAEAENEPTATIKPNGDLVITKPVEVGGQLDTIITKGEDVWRITATIQAQKISQEEIVNQILSIEAQIDAISRQEQDLLKLKRRLNNGKKNKSKTKSKN